MKPCSLQKQVKCFFPLSCIIPHFILEFWRWAVILSHCLPGSAFPKGFVFLVQKVFLLLFRTLAHIYWSHYRETLALGLHPHLNTLFTHLTLFSRQHALLEPEEIEPLQDLITALRQQGRTWDRNTHIYLLIIAAYKAIVCLTTLGQRSQ